MTPRRRRATGAATLLLLLLGAGCARVAASPVASGCPAREVELVNASSLGIEQAYAGGGAPDAWGADLLGPRGPVPSRATAAIRLPAGARAVRVVWANGRAAELPALEGCATRRVTVQDASLRAE